MSDREKVLVVVDDNEVRIHNSSGVDVVCIVDGENIQLPDDWIGRLPFTTTHSMPIDVRFAELFDNENQVESDVILEAGIHVEEEVTTNQIGRRIDRIQMRAPYCFKCENNHPPGGCPKALPPPNGPTG